MEAEEEDGIVDSIKGSGEVQENLVASAAGVCAKEKVIANLEQGRLSALFGMETVLENFKEAVGVKLGLKLIGNGAF